MAHVKAERDILSLSTKTPWVVQLFYSFQDQVHLYLIMVILELYCRNFYLVCVILHLIEIPVIVYRTILILGGDLMSMLIKYDIFSEDVTR